MKKIIISSILLILTITIFLGCSDEYGGVYLPVGGDGPIEGGSVFSAVKFEGMTNMEVSVSHKTFDTSTDSFTVAMWLKPYTPGVYMGVFTLQDDAYLGEKFQIKITNDTPQLVQALFDASGDAQLYASTSTITSNAPNFIVVKGSPGTLKICLNGGGANCETTTSGGNATYASYTPAKIYIGTNADYTEYFSGEIHAIAYWTSELADDEVESIYDSGKLGIDLNTSVGSYVSTSTLISWWKLGENHYDVMFDYGPASNNLTTYSGYSLVPYPY